MRVRRRRHTTGKPVASYRWFKFVKYRYHILGVRFIDRSDMMASIKRASAQMNRPMPQGMLDKMEAESRYFVVHARVHRKGKAFERNVVVPYDLAGDELGAYNAVQEVMRNFATMIKPKN